MSAFTRQGGEARTCALCVFWNSDSAAPLFLLFFSSVLLETDQHTRQIQKICEGCNSSAWNGVCGFACWLAGARAGAQVPLCCVTDTHSDLTFNLSAPCIASNHLSENKVQTAERDADALLLAAGRVV